MSIDIVDATAFRLRFFDAPHLKAWRRSSRGSWGQRQGLHEDHGVSVLKFGQKQGREGGGGDCEKRRVLICLHLLNPALPRTVIAALTAHGTINAITTDNTTKPLSLTRRRPFDSETPLPPVFPRPPS